MEILYEDNHIIVCVKPAGILSQEDSTGDPDMLTELKQYIKVKYSKPGNVFVGLVHRLDRPVGGVMVFARTSKAASRLSEQVRNGTLKKKYFAVIHGAPDKKRGSFKDFLVKDEKTNTVKVIKRPSESVGAREALLDYDIIKSVDFEGEKLSLTDITLHTGRSHQIRVQFASRNLPLWGDSKYGKGEKGDIALWSYFLEIVHPTTKKVMRFEKKPPDKRLWNIF